MGRGGWQARTYRLTTWAPPNYPGPPRVLAQPAHRVVCAQSNKPFCHGSRAVQDCRFPLGPYAVLAGTEERCHEHMDMGGRIVGSAQLSKGLGWPSWQRLAHYLPQGSSMGMDFHVTTDVGSLDMPSTPHTHLCPSILGNPTALALLYS